MASSDTSLPCPAHVTAPGTRFLPSRPMLHQSLPLVLLLLAALPLLWFSLIASPSLRIDIGAWGDHTFLTGVNGIERSPNEDYRWTTDHARLSLPNLSSRYRVLAMRTYGWRPDGLPPPLVRLGLGDRAWGSFQVTPEMRRYTILLPREMAGPLVEMDIFSQGYTGPDNPRVIGLALDWIELAVIERVAGPSLWHLGSQALLLMLALALVWSLALPAGWTAALGALLVSALAWANLRQPLWVSQAIGPWLALAGALLLATWLLAPQLERMLAPWMSRGQARAAWALLVAALALRLAGAIHPLFNAHDVDVHMRWLRTAGEGQLYFYSTPSENQGRPTFNPPAGYVLLLPLWLLLPDPRLVVQVGVALADTLGCLLVLLLARELRLAPLAGLLALALYLALPINTTMLWWGFATNALAQSLWLLLLWALLRLARRPSRAGMAICAVLCAITLLTHVGALFLMLAVLVLLLAFSWRRLPQGAYHPLLGSVVLALLFVAPVYFAAAAGPLLEQRGGAASLSFTWQLDWREYLSTLGWVWRALERGYLAVPIALAPLGLICLLGMRTRHQIGRALVLAWVAACLVFVAVHFGLGRFVRYTYFAAPLICLGLGALLAPLWRRPAGRTVALALVLLVAWSGTALWVAGVLLRDKPSLVPLTL